MKHFPLAASIALALAAAHAEEVQDYRFKVEKLIEGIPPVDLASWEPAYGRLAEAQVKWEAAHGRPLQTG